MAINNAPGQPCLVSIIIPMHNAEKYIADTLESILAQTFQDYEVIVVNDCSTDNSRQIAESYLEKFSGRLKIYDNEKNLGASATRNNGLRRAVGEYVFFMDSDDIVPPHSIEYMYSTAKKFDADVLNCLRIGTLSEDLKEFSEGALAPSFLDPQNDYLVEEDLEWRVKNLLHKNFMTGPWRKFSKRVFLLENRLFFHENLRFAEDHIWTYGVFLCAKKTVQTSRICYHYRSSEGSLVRTKKTHRQKINLWVNTFVCGIKCIDDIMDKLEFFKQNPAFRYEILDRFSTRYFARILKRGQTLNQRDIYESIKQTFGETWGDKDVLISQLITFVNTQQKRIAKLEEQLKAK